MMESSGNSVDVADGYACDGLNVLNVIELHTKGYILSQQKVKYNIHKK